MKISEILWNAANRYLPTKDFYSCWAVEDACPGDSYDDAMNFLSDLGCQVGSDRAFREVPKERRQEYRYAWLMFASMYAEELGL